MLVVLLLQLAATQGSADRLFADYRRSTAVAVRCPERFDPSEVTVCGRRRADRYRLPLKTAADPGDPRHGGVPAERERLLGRTNNCEEKSAFLIGCGSVGVGVKTGSGGTRAGGLRDLSP